MVNSINVKNLGLSIITGIAEGRSIQELLPQEGLKTTPQKLSDKYKSTQTGSAARFSNDAKAYVEGKSPEFRLAHLLAILHKEGKFGLAGKILKAALENVYATENGGKVSSQLWTKEKVTKVFEILRKNEIPITSHPMVRETLGERDLNLLANQITREANKNIEYASVDFEIDNLTDKEIWARIDASQYAPEILDRGAARIFKNTKKSAIC
ncbi:MAG: hypothetical protein ABIE74_11580 [Pseudomonadota bacterium]